MRPSYNETNPHFFSEEPHPLPPGKKSRPLGYHGETSPPQGRHSPYSLDDTGRGRPRAQKVEAEPSVKGMAQLEDLGPQRHGVRRAPALCVVLGGLLFLGALIFLIIYLLSRPKSPRLDISSATLNAAYMNMGNLLSADVSLVAEFSNPDGQAGADLRAVVFDLYHEGTVVTARSVYPLSLQRMESMFASFRMIGTQVPVAAEEARNFTLQLESNQVAFTVKGRFRVVSDAGSFLRYRYWVNGECGIVMTRPPCGSLLARKCRTWR